jgi:hypothetical protein
MVLDAMVQSCVSIWPSDAGQDIPEPVFCLVIENMCDLFNVTASQADQQLHLPWQSLHALYSVVPDVFGQDAPDPNFVVVIEYVLVSWLFEHDDHGENLPTQSRLFMEDDEDDEDDEEPPPPLEPGNFLLIDRVEINSRSVAHTIVKKKKWRNM